METINSLETLRTLYPEASQGSLDKVMSEITPLYRAWIEASRFVIVSTVGAEGTDASPRGGSRKCGRHSGCPHALVAGLAWQQSPGHADKYSYRRTGQSDVYGAGL